MTPLDLMKSLGACDNGQAYAATCEQLTELFEKSPRAEFILFWHRRHDRHNPGLREFCRLAMANYAIPDRSSKQIEAEFRYMKPEGQLAYVGIAAYSMARAAESTERKQPFIAAAGVSQWLCAAAAAICASRGGSPKQCGMAVAAEQAVQAELLRACLPNPFADTMAVA